MDIASVLGGTRCEIVDLPWRDYCGLAALNPSTIAHGLTSMLHLKYAWDHGDTRDTASMAWGRALHCLLFEPREFENRYRYWTGRCAGSEYEDFAFRAYKDGAEVLREKHFCSVQEAALGFINAPRVRELIAEGKAERVLFCPEGGVQCRGRVDWISTGQQRLVDLKTTKNIDARRFSKDFYDFHYDVKLGLYQRWLNLITGLHWPVDVIAVENRPPYDIAVIPIPEAVLDCGASKGLAVIAQVKRCIETGVWPGIGAADSYYLVTPAWEMDEPVEFDEEPSAHGEADF